MIIREERSRRRTLLDAALGVSIVLSTLSGLFLYYINVYFDFGVEPPTRSDYVSGAGATLWSALLLGLAVPVLIRLRAAPWTYVLTGIGAAVHLILLGSCAVNASVAKTDGDAEYGFFYSAMVLTWIPTNWPLLLFIVVIAVRVLTTPSSPGPPAPQDR